MVSCISVTGEETIPIIFARADDVSLSVLTVSAYVVHMRPRFVSDRPHVVRVCPNVVSVYPSIIIDCLRVIRSRQSSHSISVGVFIPYQYVRSKL